MIRTALALALLPAVLVLPGASGSATSASGATFPDTNGRIAFRRFLDSDKTWGALFTIRQDGTGERRVTHPPKGSVDANPDVSPDGRRIVFQRRSATSDEIWVVNADGTGLQPITQQPFAGATCDTGGYCDTAPSWSPDGLRIAFGRAFGPVRHGLIERAALVTVAADGSDVRQLTQLDLPATGEDSEPQFSPDGERLLFQRWNVRSARPADGVALWILDLTTMEESRITPFRLRAGTPPTGRRTAADPVPRQSRGAGRCIGEPLHDPPERQGTAAARVRGRRCHPVPRLVLLAGREEDRLRPPPGDGWGRGGRGRPVRDADRREPRAPGDQDRAVRQLSGLGPSSLSRFGRAGTADHRIGRARERGGQRFLSVSFSMPLTLFAAALSRFSVRFSLMDFPDFLDIPCRGDLSLMGSL